MESHLIIEIGVVTKIVTISLVIMLTYLFVATKLYYK